MTVLPIHILAGVLALVFGYVALFAKKGATLHRKSGMLFVFAMVMLSLTGALIAFVNASPVSVVAGLLTFYFVTTSLLTVRPLHESRWIDTGAMLFALAVAILGFTTGIELSSTGSPATAPMFIFGGMGLLAAAGDVRMMRAGGLQGPFDSAQGEPRRIARHLWRMCFAMWVAAASFFWGPPGRVPAIIYYPALLPIPVLLPIVVMLYWLWRIRVRQTLHGIAGVSTPQTTAIEARASL